METPGALVPSGESGIPFPKFGIHTEGRGTGEFRRDRPFPSLISTFALIIMAIAFLFVSGIGTL